MVDPGSEVTEFPALVVTLIVGATIIVIVYISSLFKSQKEEAKKRTVVEPVIKEKQHQQHHQQQHTDAGNARKKKQQEKWRADTKQNYTHPWLVTSLKGHGGAVLDMDFSPNGKFLASCAEDGGGSGSSSGSEGNKENNPVIPTQGLTRRQKKNHRVRRDDSSSPGTAVKKKQGNGRSKNNNNNNNHNNNNSSSNNHNGNACNNKQSSKSSLTIPDMMLIQYLQHYLLKPEEMLWLGYPVESALHPGQAIVFKRSMDAVKSKSNHPSGFDVNAREFVPKECLYASSLVERNSDPDLDPRISTPVSQCRRTSGLKDLDRGEERKCVRCAKEFFVTCEGTYLTQEQCLYHWGKLKKQFTDTETAVYECCRAKQNTKGCTTAKLHVWNGLHENSVNGPLHGFVRTRPRKTPRPDGCNGVYALDCEMCYTTQGLELAKITVVGADGRLVYDTYVKPENEVIDYNTRFSGVTAKEMNKKGAAKSLKDVQNDLMGFINADTILIGHGAENDLIALKMIHTTIVDTSIVFPHYFGLPYRRSLKSLVWTFLQRVIQAEASGHNSFEDARSCLELMFWKLRSDMGNISHHSILSNKRL